MAIVETIRDSQVEFATREDLHAGLERLEFVLRDEIGNLRTELHAESSRLEIGMQNQLATMYWRLLIGISIVVGIFGTLVTLANGA